MLKKPEWLRIPYTENPNKHIVESILEKLNLNTVCAEASCPNYSDCFSQKTATFMILGTNCTRNCSFCNVNHALPHPADENEPDNISKAVAELSLRYVVITSVTRDDLPDGGAGHFAKVIRKIQTTSPETAIEVLIPDFGGCLDSLDIVTNSAPTVISHNMETVASLYSSVRPDAEYRRSLNLLKNIKLKNANIHSKSGIMLGLGEKKNEVLRLFDDLREVQCEFLTIGQYLAPSKNHFPVYEYVHPDKFKEYGEIALSKGFSAVASGPLVRSSYKAETLLKTV